jgi:SAM-dependent methyltransferase
MSQPPGTEQATDWESMWQQLDDDERAELRAEQAGLRWRTQVALVNQQFGSFQDLRVIEIGAGRSTNALLYALEGAHATVLDISPTALEHSRRRFAERGVPLEAIQGDAFDLPTELLDRFDVAMSFGLCEHFLGERRKAIVDAHLRVLRPGGLAVINVPHRYSPFYRAWMGLAKRRGTWKLGTEVPYSAGELQRLARAVGGSPLPAVHVGGLGTIVSQGVNPVLQRLGRRPLPVPQVRVPGVDFLAYDLLVPILRPGG